MRKIFGMEFGFRPKEEPQPDIDQSGINSLKKKLTLKQEYRIALKKGDTKTKTEKESLYKSAYKADLSRDDDTLTMEIFDEKNEITDNQMKLLEELKNRRDSGTQGLDYQIGILRADLEKRQRELVDLVISESKPKGIPSESAPGESTMQISRENKIRDIDLKIKEIQKILDKTA